MKRWRFYRTKRGRPVVREELRDLGEAAEAAVAEALKRHQHGQLMPYEEEHIDGALHAVRIFFDGNTYRVLYAYEGRRDRILLALHVMHKKDRKLPKRARWLAERRLREWRSNPSA